jgi:prophage antirepressor-like protein
MLNIFRSPNKQVVIQDNQSVLVRQFNGLNIQVYGTYEEPLFKAKDIGELLEIKDIKSTIRDFDDDEVHSMYLIDSLDRMQDTNMLTEQGLYKILMISRKPIARSFQK